MSVTLRLILLGTRYSNQGITLALQPLPHQMAVPGTSILTQRGVDFMLSKDKFLATALQNTQIQCAGIRDYKKEQTQIWAEIWDHGLPRLQHKGWTWFMSCSKSMGGQWVPSNVYVGKPKTKIKFKWYGLVAGLQWDVCCQRCAGIWPLMLLPILKRVYKQFCSCMKHFKFLLGSTLKTDVNSWVQKALTRQCTKTNIRSYLAAGQF